jgi:hypothetical protein
VRPQVAITLTGLKITGTGMARQADDAGRVLALRTLDDSAARITINKIRTISQT